MLPRIEAIVSVLNFSIITKWNTGELRSIDFQPILAPHRENKNSTLGRLSDPKIFSKVKFDPVAKTLYWDDLLTLRNPDGSTEPAPLDFCPDVLFSKSVLVLHA
jgi:hypothetical protein